jgi:hypothetical protein
MRPKNAERGAVAMPHKPTAVAVERDQFAAEPVSTRWSGLCTPRSWGRP